jgi:hypothetical protein
MTNHKRKSDDVFSETTNRVVVVGDNNNNNNNNNKSNHTTNNSNNNESSIDQLKRKLQSLRKPPSNDVEEDPILSAMESVDDADGHAEQALMDESSRIHSRLAEEIQQAEDACQAESGILRHVAQQTTELQHTRQSLWHQMQELEEQQVDLQAKIASHTEEASQEIESIDLVEEERKRQVPRLKTQISLYATTTGIKWDFAQDDILSGSVVRIRIRVILESSTERLVARLAWNALLFVFVVVATTGSTYIHIHTLTHAMFLVFSCRPFRTSRV